MGCGSKKRGILARRRFGRRGNILHEIYHIIFQLLLVVAVVSILFLYTNRLTDGVGFEKRFTSIDLALLTTTVFYAPGTLKVEHQVIPFKVPVEVSFSESKVFISEPGTDLPPMVYWHLSNLEMDVLRDSASLLGTRIYGGDDYTPANITFYKAGRQVALSEGKTNPFQIVCPSVNTSVTDWQSQRIFVPRVFSDQAAYSDNTRTENRVATIMRSKYPGQIMSDAGSSAGAAKISGIPADADLIIALGDAGEQRESGSLVAYIPVNDDMLKARKLACLLINNLLTPETVVFYVQIMPVFVDNLDAASPLNVFREISKEGQVMVFLDLSKFSSAQSNPDALASALIRAVEQYYGGYDLAAITGAPVSYTTASAGSASVPSVADGSVEAALDKIPVPGAGGVG